MTDIDLKLDHAGIAEILKGQCAGVVAAAGAAAAANARQIAPPVDHHRTPAPIDATPGITDRAVSVVRIVHPAGMGLQAKYGVLTKAASAAGLEVTER